MGLWIHCFTGSTGLAGMTMVLDRLVCWPEFECVFADNTQKIWACGMEEGGETQGNLSLFMQISSIHGAICCEWFKSEKCHKMRKHNVERNKKLNLKKTFKFVSLRNLNQRIYNLRLSLSKDALQIFLPDWEIKIDYSSQVPFLTLLGTINSICSFPVL